MSGLKFIPALLVLAATSAHAEFYTGNELLTMLNSTGADLGAGMGYVAGVHDVGRNAVHCTPQTVTLGQVTDMTRKVLKAEPETRNLSADVIVLTMLSRAWPCEAKKVKPSI